MLDILVVSPHPDDAELGMGGAILKFRAEGLAVGVLDLTDGEPTPFSSPEIRRRETAAATNRVHVVRRCAFTRSVPTRSVGTRRLPSRVFLHLSRDIRSSASASRSYCAAWLYAWAEMRRIICGAAGQQYVGTSMLCRSSSSSCKAALSSVSGG